MPKFDDIVSTSWRVLLALLFLSIALGVSGCAKGSGEKRQDTSPKQPDDLLSRLDRKTLSSYCGEGEGEPDPGALHYNFGSFSFEEGGTVLMTASVKLSDETVRWTNVHRESTDKLLRQHDDNLVLVATTMARLEGVNVNQFESRNAVNILNNSPCLYLLTAH
jgi:hypothetical protein